MDAGRIDEKIEEVGKRAAREEPRVSDFWTQLSH